MRGAFRPSHCFDKHHPRGENSIRSSRLIIVLSVLLIATALRAQSEKNSIPISGRSTSIGELSPHCHPCMDDLAFNLDTRPTAVGDNLELADPSRSGPPI